VSGVAEPRDRGWVEWPIPLQAFSRGLAPGTRAWRRDAAEAGAYVQVLSSAVEGEYRGVILPQLHVSALVRTGPSSERRCTDDEIAEVRRAFDMEDAEEDNHSSSLHRNLFRVLALPRGETSQCGCKEDEETVVEPDGFTYQRPR